MDIPRLPNAKGFWTAAARRLAWRRNFAGWCDFLLPVFLVLAGAAAVALVVLRLLDLKTHWLWIAWIIGLLFGGIAGLIRLKPFTLEEAFACLDEAGRLHNRLISAYAGIGDWPAPRRGVKDPARWNWPRLLTPVISAGLLLAASSLVQPARSAARHAVVDEPGARSQTASWLKTLDQSKLADPQALQALQAQLDDLRRQPAEEWYDQDQLEAGETMRQQMEQGLQEMQSSLQKGTDVIAAAVQKDGQLSSPQLKELSSAFQQARQGLQSGNLPASKELLDQMQNFNPADLHQMTPQQFADLQKRMAEGLKTCSQCVSPKIVAGSGKKEGEGNGGPGGGGPTQPLDLNSTETNLQTKRLEPSKGDDMSRALPGDVLAVTKGRHVVDKNAPAEPVTGGAISSAGTGGDAVWRDSLTPDDQHVLERYFK